MANSEAFQMEMEEPENAEEGSTQGNNPEEMHTEANVDGERPSYLSDIVFEPEDVPYEEDIIRNEYSLRSWQRYIEHKIKTKAPPKQVRLVYERALKNFNRSYKLWYNYLRYRRKVIVHKPPTDAAYARLCDAYDRCLVYLNKMPRIWMDYCDLMVKRGLITETRRVFDRAIRALPVTQHMRIWPKYIDFVTSQHMPETTIRVYRRYLKIFPAAREDFVEYLRKIDRLDEAASQMAILVNEDKPVTEKGKTTHQIWTELCELVSKNPNKIFSLNVEPIIRQGIYRYSDQVGVLWLALAEYYIRVPNFERARDIYEEAIVSVRTVRDFTQLFDGYSKFMERLTSQKMNEFSSAKPAEVEDKELELELFMTRFEHLMDRRPLLLNSVLLRQNPHNAHEWSNRVQLYEGLQDKQIETFKEAIKTVEPKQQVGKLSSIWIAYAKFYERHGSLDKARMIFEDALHVSFAKVEELAAVWCEYVEFEIRNSTFEDCVKLLKRATALPPKRANYGDETEKVQYRVHRSLRVWSLYADLEESCGTVDTCKSVYERILDLRIATPQIVINYASYLEDNKYFEDSFKAFEKGISLFRWPLVYDIWNIYLHKFIKRYGGKKLERARDLFEQCLEHCPTKFAKNIYLLYAGLEEEHGLPRHAMSIYNRATKAVEKDEMHLIFNIYVNKAMEFFGITHTRPIFQQAIEILPEDRSREMSLRFAQVERSLGEIDRARAIYAHCAEICDPRVHGQFWETWKDFEIKHGNEDTVREMLRVKRSVQAAYNTNVNYMSAQMLASIGGKAEVAGELSAADSMAQLEARAQRIVQEEAIAARKLAFTSENGERPISFIRGESKTTQESVTENPEEIAIDEDDEEEGEALETRTVPDSVFSSLGNK